MVCYGIIIIIIWLVYLIFYVVVGFIFEGCIFWEGLEYVGLFIKIFVVFMVVYKRKDYIIFIFVFSCIRVFGFGIGW